MTACHLSGLRAHSRALSAIAILSIVAAGAAVAQIAEKPVAENVAAEKRAAELTLKEAGPPEGFVDAKVKADAPNDVKQFFADSDQARLAVIETQRTAIERATSKLYGLRRKRLLPDDLAQQTEDLQADIAYRNAVIEKLLTDVEYIPVYESLAGANQGSKVLKLGMVLRFSRPVRIVRVAGKDRAVITVEQQVLVKRTNKSGQEITAIDSKPAKALAKVDTAGMTAGKRFEFHQPLHVTATELLDGATVFVLEPFRAADYLERSPDEP